MKTKILLAGLIHFIIALIYRHIVGLSITNGNWIDTWESMWQAIPLNQLSESPLTSIYYFHAQPPVFNTLLATLVKLAPNNPLGLLQTVYILLGVVMVMMSGVIIYHLISRQIVADILLFIITLHASLFIYEAYELQTHLTAFLVICVIFCLV